MGFLSGLFKDKKTTTTNSNQTADQQYGLSDEANAYWQSIAGRYQQPWTNVDPNAYQTNAASAMPGYAAGLNPAMYQALQIGAQGLDPNSIARFQNPYEDQVVRSSIRGIRDEAGKTGAMQEAAAAKAGALGGTSNINRRLIRDQGTDDLIGDTTGKLRQAGFNTASGLAQGSLQAQLAGIQNAGNIANAQANINNQGFQQGTQLWNQGWQNAMMPYQIGQMGAGTLAGLAGVSGNKTSGTSTGTQTMTGSPSPFSALMNIGGLFATAYGSDERIKENIKPIGETYDGQPIYKYNYKDSPKTQIGLIAQDVEGRVPEAVGSVAGIKTVDYDVATKDAERGRPMASGGSVAPPKPGDPMEKFTRAFESISGMLQRSRGGSVARAGSASGLAPSRASGGPVGSWETTVTPASPGMDWKYMGQGMSKLGQQSSTGGDDGGDLLGQQQASLSQLMSSMTPRRAAGGGAWGETGPEFEERPSGLGTPMFLGAGSEPVERRALPPPNVIEAIKGFEGYNPRAYSDYKQHSVGYGTRATHPGETIDKAEAERRLASEVGRAQEIVDKFAPNLDPGTRAALTSLTYNAGADWQRAGLGAAIRRGDMDDARARFVQYTKAGGEDLPGLVARRQAEAAWMGGPQSSDAAPVRVASAAGVSDAEPPMGLGTAGDPEAARRRAVAHAVQAEARAAESGRQYASAQEGKSWLQRILPGSGEGLLAGKPMTALDRAGIAMMKIRGPLFESMTGGAADALLDMNKTRIAEQENERAAERYAKQLQMQLDLAMGSVNGQKTLEARRQEADQAARDRAAQFDRDRALGTVDGQKTLDARRVEADAAERERAAKMERDRALGSIDGQPTVDARRVSAEEVERKARLTGLMPDGSKTQQAQLNDVEFEKAKMQREMEALKLADIKEPEKLYARRDAIAKKYNLKEGTPEYINWIFDGKIPDKTGANETTTQKEVAKAEVEMAQKAIASGSGAKDVLRVVDQLRALPETKNFENAIGPLDDYKMWQSIAGSIPILNALTNPTTSAEIKRLQSQLELAGGEKMKGLGAQSDKDAERLANAVSGLSSARNSTEYYAALRVIEESVTAAYNRAAEAGKKFPALGGDDFSKAQPRQIKPSPHQALIEAREAIRKGASKDAVAAELRKMGIDPGGL